MDHESDVVRISGGVFVYGLVDYGEVEKHSTSRCTDNTIARMEMWNSAVRRQHRKMFIGLYIYNKSNK
ncbi:hypothetical protein RB195_014061 [Necator americanus]|uniref:Uncharacterized protein n=1 Tax=Necator americanus TaxID=51031 RepID=A0ABR1DYF8_NECAM